MDLKELGYYKMVNGQTPEERAEGAAMVALAEAQEEDYEEAFIEDKEDSMELDEKDDDENCK